jgi:Phosphotransferase enzyme family
MAGPDYAVPGGARIGWNDLPVVVRTGIEDVLGARVTVAAAQHGGFSPGCADRVRLDDGRRVFIKAVGRPLNPDSPAMHRAEAAILAQLPADYPAPQLLGTFDDGTWVALVCADVDGRLPRQPWRIDELARVLDAVDELALRSTPSPAVRVQSTADVLQSSFTGWRRLAGGESTASLDPWVLANLDRLATLEERWQDAAKGSTLLHADIRADNLLLTPAGGVVFVDWAWACVGASWIDLLLLLPSVALAGGPLPADIWASRAVAAHADPDRVDAVLAAFSGFLVRQSRQPPPPGLPTVRAFQAAQGGVALDWLRRRLSGATAFS